MRAILHGLRAVPLGDGSRVFPHLGDNSSAHGGLEQAHAPKLVSTVFEDPAVDVVSTSYTVCLSEGSSHILGVEFEWGNQMA